MAMNKAPARLETERLVLRRPRPDDAEAIYARYASDPDVTRYLSWPRHESIADTRGFLDFSDAEWARWPAGPYMVDVRATGELVGGTGLGFEAPGQATTGYVFARDAWGLGYATETLHAMVALAQLLGVPRLHALCHPDHGASQRVLLKCGFTHEATLSGHAPFPNLAPGTPATVLSYVVDLDLSELDI